MSNFLEVGLKTAKIAQKIILSYYQKNIRINKKNDLSPVTIADKKAEKAIITTIKKYFPTHSFLAEESGQAGNSIYQWIIDPIDGTKNFIRGIPYFSTLIALKKNNKIILGISHNPALNTTIYAETGKGAYLNKKQIKVSNINKLSDAWISHSGLNFFIKHKLDNKLINISKRCNRTRGFGDFWQYELLAQGKFDIILEAKIGFWDVAPFIVIIKEAGGKITDIFGKELNENSTTACATNGSLHNKVIKYFKE